MEKLYNLSEPQNSIMLTEQFYQGTSINNIGGTSIIKNTLNFDVLKQAINNFVKNNDSFRIRLVKKNNKVKQYIQEFSEFDIEILDVENEEEVKNIEKIQISKPFDLFNGPLFEFKLFKFKDNSGGYILIMHHCITDAWTSGLLCRKIMNEYSNILNNVTEMPNSKESYVQYLKSEETYFSSNKFEKDKSYWLEKFETIPNIVSIPSMSDLQNNFSCEANRQTFTISKQEVNKIATFCKEHSISLFNFFMSILSIYVYKINSIDDFVIGTPILNRTNVTEKNTAGMFINMAPLRISFKNITKFSDIITKIVKNSMGLLRHQKYPYQNILKDIRKQDPSIPNLYNIVLSYQNSKATNESEFSYSTHWAFNNCCIDDIDIHIYDLDEEKILNISYDYKISKYNNIDIQNLHNRLMYIIKQVLKNGEIEIKDIEIVTPEEKHKILSEFNNTTTDFPKNKNIIDLFEEQVEKHPNHIAVVFENEKLTYKELNKKSNQLAWYLKEKGIEKGAIIATCMNRNIYLIISIMATLKLGCSYLPINPDYPDKRISYILKNSKSAILLTNFENNLDFSIKQNIAKLDLSNYNSNNLNTSIKINDLAYIIYTSGSTGNPKGVMVQHNNLINFIYDFNKQFDVPFCEQDNCLSITNISFDVSICEIFVPLLLGCKLVLFPENTLKNISLLCEILEQEKITFLYLPPNILLTIYQFIIESNINTYFNKLLVGVEPIKSNILNNFVLLNPKIEIVNGYGPTETTICITYFKYEKNNTIDGIVPIGKPISNNEVIIVNSDFNILPMAVPGEILVSGENVTRGYLNNEEITKENFININNKIYYRTGDIGVWLPDGNIMFKNRNDSQIKFRGHRIELNEINLAIKKISGIVASITLLQNHDTSYLCSYITCENNLNSEQIKLELEKYLPNYMIPNFIIILKEMPLTLNGKIDKKALPLPNLSNNTKKLILPKNDTEKTLVQIFSSVFNIEKISMDDSFFELGGDSLIAINLTIQIYNKFKIQLSVKDIFDHYIISDLSDYIANYETSKITIEKTKIQDFYHASSAQKRIYYASKADGENTILYNIPGALVFDTIPDIEKLKKCFDILFERHESLRTYFEIKNNDIVQKIAPNINFKLEIQNSTSTNTDYLLKQFIKPFNLAKAPLFRATLVIQNNKSATLLIDMHHAISDGSSITLLLNELSKLYNNQNLDEKVIDYKDFAEWELSHFVTSDFKESEHFWLENFDGDLPVLNMPTTYPRPINQSFDGNSFYFEIDKKLKNKIVKLTKELNVSPYIFLLTCYYILLYKYTNQEDIIVGTPITGRDLPELSNVVGMFVNSLPLQINLKSSISFKTFLNNVKKMCLGAFEHQDYPFDLLVNKLNLQRNTDRSPLFDTMFIYQNMGAPTLNFKEMNITYVEAKNNVSKFDFSLELIPNKENLNLRFEYCTKLFNEEFIHDLADRYLHIIESVTNDISTKISNIEMISEQEKNQILYDFNNTDLEYDKITNIQTIFEQNVEKTPEKTAIIFENEEITYKKLNEKANQFANYLMQNNAKRNDIIGIMMSRSWQTILCMLGTLKAGCGYVLIDSSLPKERIEFMLNNCKAKMLITSSKLKKIDFENTYKFDIENLKYYNMLNPNIENNNDDIFSIIYTSGSTGIPKGIGLKRQGIINLVLNYEEILDTKKCDTFISIASVAFDMFIVETFIPLLTGKIIILTNDEEQKIPQYANKLIIKYNADFILTTPSRIELMISDSNATQAFNNLKIIQLGGENLTSTLLQKLVKYTKANIFNGYGPSEITACCSNKKLPSNDGITIGKPNFNTQIYILDKDLNLCPIGITGEICISGDGIAKGYMDNTEMTKKSFIKNPFGDGMLYKSGDLGKFNKEGEIEYIGRKDFQIKIRGLRVELSEIENKFLEIPEIDKSAVIYKQDEEDNYLVGYFTANTDIDISDIRKNLSKSLPLYMVPKYIIKLDNMPITTNGKIDKKELDKQKIPKQYKQTYTPPENELQQLFCDTWNRFLHTQIGIDDNIFEMGVDSLMAIKFKTAIMSYNIDIAYSTLFKYPTVRALSEYTQIQEIISDLSGFDYTKINKILEKNNIELIKNAPIAHNHKNNILLLGSNGFVGSHILYNFIQQDLGTAYCIIREKNNKSAENRLLDSLHFYFDNELDNFIGNRIVILKGDITKENFGLSNEIYDDITHKISTVINSASIVKHHGNIKKFKNVNITLTKKLCEYCQNNRKKLLHLSTMSISENSNIDSTYVGSRKYEGTEFAENNLYIGQILNNDYTSAKFEAERIILSSMVDGLNAKIIRLGNITNRISDGKFRIHPEENSFANKLKSFINLKEIPDYLQALPLEFTPVDLCAKAIIYILQNNIKELSVYHLYNDKNIYLKDFVDIINTKNINLSFVDSKKFKSVLKKMLDNPETEPLLSGIINDLNNENELIYEKDIDLKSDLTKTFLQRLGFVWPNIAENYIEKYLNYMQKIDFFKEDEK